MEWDAPPPGLSGHVVICNASPEVRPLVAELHAETARCRPDVVLVLQDVDLWAAHPAWQPDHRVTHTRDHFFVIAAEGGPADPENLRAAGVIRASAAVILADPRQGSLADARSTLVAVAIEHLSARVHTVMELIAAVNRVHVAGTAVDEVVCVGELVERLVAQSCVTPGIKNVFARLLSNDRQESNLYFARIPPAMVGFPYREVARRAIRAGVPFVICGFVHAPRAETPTEAPAPAPLDCRGQPPTAPPGGRGQSPTAPPEGAAMVLNPRSEEHPGKDTPLGEDDRLIVLAQEPPDLGTYLATLDFVVKGRAVATPMF
jgi:hypothetical protein